MDTDINTLFDDGTYVDNGLAGPQLCPMDILWMLDFDKKYYYIQTSTSSDSRKHFQLQFVYC